MNNIFKEAYWGKKYKTRDGRCAVYLDDFFLHIQGEPTYKRMSYFVNGHYNDEYAECNDDIVGVWEEPIDETDLDKIAEQYNAPLFIDTDKGLTLWYRIKEAFKAGYRTAKERL